MAEDRDGGEEDAGEVAVCVSNEDAGGVAVGGPEGETDA